MAEAENFIQVQGTTSVTGRAREVWLARGQPGRVVLTIYAGQKAVAAVVPIHELRLRLDELDRR